jgi:hypothetical protein
MKKTLFYILSFTWGLPLTLVGLIVALVLTMLGYKPKRHGYCFYFEVGENWGGLELGLCFLRDHKSCGGQLDAHEFGHTFQNALFGPLFIFLVWIPSARWYWSKSSKPYDSMWFEDAATQCGLYASKFLSNKEISE